MIAAPVPALLCSPGLLPASPVPSPIPAAAAVEASYYGSEFAGKATASGEVFDSSALTAAHRTLPFGSLVEVVDAVSGKTVVVRINDRGPFHADREIDLSEAAARKIGMTESGTSIVNLNVVGRA